jgi:hypothetical protein
MAATVQAFDLPAAWIQAVRRHALEPRAQSFLMEASRYLSQSSADRVPPGREAETLKNLLHAYLQPAEHDAVLHELAASSLARERSAATGAGLAALGGAALAGLALVRSRRR